MRIAILSRTDGWHYQDFLRAAKNTHEIFAASYMDLSAKVATGTSEIRLCNSRLDSVDCVIVRAMPKGSLEQVVFRMDALQQLRSSGVCILNSPRTIEASVDKYLSLALLQEHEIPIPPTGVCQSSEVACELFEQLGGDVLVKPIFGSQGRGIRRIRDLGRGREYFRWLESEQQVIYLQKFIDHGGFDLRLLVVGEEVFAISRHRSDHWITNVSCGAQAKKHLSSDEEKQFALRSARAVGGFIVGVDLVYDRAGNPFVIELNSAPGWQALSKTLDVDIAAEILSFANREAANPAQA